ncbi:MAG TPA: hypothetical protein PK950_01315 [Candidatus Paceibacterota bacterium]|nr:hypothetical protein [Candidatus Paceibacterota bacterium]
MLAKGFEKDKAIQLRKDGKTYSEILKAIPVAKSTLSLWLRKVGIAKEQVHQFSEKKRLSSLRGSKVRKDQRIQRQKSIIDIAKIEIGEITDRELFLIGIALYWAEGSKEKEWQPGSSAEFNNMDATMIRVFLAWLIRIVKVPKNMLVFEISLHENHQLRVPEVLGYWQKVTGFEQADLYKVYFKRNSVKTTNRRNTGAETYFGLLRIRVKQSSTLLRKITGWTSGIVEGLA